MSEIELFSGELSFGVAVSVFDALIKKKNYIIYIKLPKKLPKHK